MSNIFIWLVVTVALATGWSNGPPQDPFAGIDANKLIFVKREVYRNKCTNVFRQSGVGTVIEVTAPIGDSATRIIEYIQDPASRENFKLFWAGFDRGTESRYVFYNQKDGIEIVVRLYWRESKKFRLANAWFAGGCQ